MEPVSEEGQFTLHNARGNNTEGKLIYTLCGGVHLMMSVEHERTPSYAERRRGQ